MDDKIVVSCNNCGVKVRAPMSLVGKKAKCPKCQNIIEIVAPEEPLAPIERMEENQPPPPEEESAPPPPAPVAKQTEKVPVNKPITAKMPVAKSSVPLRGSPA